MMKKMIVIFKTHLDVGFTDLADHVVSNYIHHFIPKALSLAKSMRNEKHHFIWTTGSWLIDQFLRQADPESRQAIEDAIAHGEISWHGLPVTSHTELMDVDLLRYGLTISQRLDQAYGVNTIAAKMTDVPGHTRALVPELAKAGIKFLHIGVNPACPVPEVPSLFRWRDDSGAEILVMYNGGYGQYTEIPGTDTSVYFAHTNDNLGPQSKEDVEALYSQLEKEYPDTIIQAGTLNDLAEAALQAKNLPVIISEIGDSWIHGVQSDPEKVRRYRELLRACRELPPQERIPVYEQLLMVPEHTWGMYVLLDQEHYTRAEFEKARRTDPRYAEREASWQEQRDYVLKAEAAYEAQTGRPYTPTLPRFPDLSGWQAFSPEQPLSIGDWQVRFNPSGAICSLTRNGQVLADPEHLLGEVLYQTYSAQDYSRFLDEYLKEKLEFALQDFQKQGMEKADVPSVRTAPAAEGFFRSGNSAAAVLRYTGAPHDEFGAPSRLCLVYTFRPDGLDVELQWQDKPACRMAEAMWLGFHVMDTGCQISKLSRWINPADTVRRGGRKIHGTDWGVRFDHSSIESPDCALVNLGSPSLLRFQQDPIPVDDGVYFNLHNNVWGTNFVMWYEDDACFRFRCQFGTHM